MDRHIARTIVRNSAGDARVIWSIFSGYHLQGLRESGGKKMAASVKPKQNGGLKEHFCVGILLVFLENTCFHIEKAPRKTTAL